MEKIWQTPMDMIFFIINIVPTICRMGKNISNIKKIHLFTNQRKGTALYKNSSKVLGLPGYQNMSVY